MPVWRKAEEDCRRFGIDLFGLFGFTKWNTIDLNSARVHGKLL